MTNLCYERGCCARDAEGATAGSGAKHRSEAEPVAARPEALRGARHNYSFFFAPSTRSPFMRKLCFVFSFLIFYFSIIIPVAGQINPAAITIARDSFGVPHIYGHTDADAAYGLAWAHCEDDFTSINQKDF
jgi:hypothetical protein